MIVCRCTQHYRQPSWSTPTQCIHCSTAQTVQSERAGAEQSRAEEGCDFQHCALLHFKTPSLHKRDNKRVKRRRRRCWRRGAGQPCSRRVSLSCNREEEEEDAGIKRRKAAPLKHLLKLLQASTSGPFFPLCFHDLTVFHSFLSCDFFGSRHWFPETKPTAPFFPRWCCFGLASAESSCLI